LRAALDLLDAGLNCSHEDVTTCPSYRAQVAELMDARAADLVDAEPDGSAIAR
jgi:hypothetical protein